MFVDSNQVKNCAMYRKQYSQELLKYVHLSTSPDRTFSEADRVLKPGETLVICGYLHMDFCEKLLNDAMTKIIVKILPYWPEESKSVFD
ncbi:hypothetical protein RRG08_010442 [Elysia crispata]|uniref:Uncharacterized protein n=1 Tax=Elysia crispata TaxID=231223 RepID=A0AAE1AC94_9GAST|nr:hypothetical protein RRG08_010442 [Elysia crispata]